MQRVRCGVEEDRHTGTVRCRSNDAIIPEKASWGSRTRLHARGTTMRVDAV
jgi:hypothetical protein